MKHKDIEKVKKQTIQLMCASACFTTSLILIVLALLGGLNIIITILITIIFGCDSVLIYLHWLKMDKLLKNTE